MTILFKNDFTLTKASLLKTMRFITRNQQYEKHEKQQFIN